MPSQFQGFCYSSIQEAAYADVASGVYAVSSGLVSPVSFSVLDTTSVSMTYSYVSLTHDVASSYIQIRVYPLCTSVGQVSNNSGVSITDALTVSWLVVAVWAVAFYFRTARIGARGY